MFFKRSISEPWVGTPSVDAAFERVRRERGIEFVRRTGVSFADERIPADLVRLYEYFDPALWARFIDQQEMNNPEDNKNMLALLSAEEVRVVVPGRDQGWCLHPDIWNAYVEEGEIDSEWLETPVVHFGYSVFGDSIFIPTRSVGRARVGSVLTTTEDDPVYLVLADTVADWIAKLSCCDGYEYTVVPGELDQVARRLRSMIRDDFERLNPGIWS